MANHFQPTAIVIPPEPQLPTQPSYNPLATTSQFKSPELLKYIQLNIKAGVDLEWCNKTLLNWSKNAPMLVNKFPWVLDYLLGELQKFNKSCALALRNLAQDPEFTQALALHPRSRTIIFEVLSQYEKLDQDEGEPVVVVVENRGSKKNVDGELLSYTIDIVEAISSYFAPAPKDDEVILILIKIFLKNDDRNLLMAMMRSFARFLVRSSTTGDDCSYDLSTDDIWDKVTSFLLTKDYELIITSLDLLYQFSLAGQERIQTLLKTKQRQEVLKSSVVNLLTFQLPIQIHPRSLSNLEPLRLTKRSKPAKPVVAPKLPSDLFNVIKQMDEPLRATAWMRSVYRAVASSEVTQISLWKSYESQFEGTERKMLPAVDFIKNVSKAFAQSNAMVIQLDDGGRRFIIKGIEPRHEAVDLLTGEKEAFADPLKDSDVAAGLSSLQTKASQEPIGPYIAPEVLNEVNLSCSNLLNCITSSRFGKEVFKSTKSDIWQRVSVVPALATEISETLKVLED